MAVEVMQVFNSSHLLVLFPDPITHARKGSGDIGADSWFCKLSNRVIICIDVYWRMCSHVMVRKTKKTLQCPYTFSLLRVESGNETTHLLDCINVPTTLYVGCLVFVWRNVTVYIKKPSTGGVAECVVMLRLADCEYH